MILGIGVDIMEVSRMRREISRKGGGFAEGVFSEGEILRCGGMRHSARHYAARFAAKEAFFKALGTGWRGGMSWRDVEVRSDALGKPSIALSGKAGRLATEKGIAAIHLSLSHTARSACAVVVLEGRTRDRRKGR